MRTPSMDLNKLFPWTSLHGIQDSLNGLLHKTRPLDLTPSMDFLVYAQPMDGPTQTASMDLPAISSFNGRPKQPASQPASHPSNQPDSQQTSKLARAKVCKAEPCKPGPHKEAPQVTKGDLTKKSLAKEDRAIKEERPKALVF